MLATEPAPHNPPKIYPENPGAAPLLVFQAAASRFVLPVKDVREVMHMAELSSPPGMPVLLAGFLNLRGIAIPIVKIHPLLGLPARPPGLYSAIMILAAAKLGLLVDELAGIVSPPAASYVALGGTHTFNGCSEQAVEAGAGLLPLLIPERLLLEQERRSLAEMQAVAQQRLSDMEACRA